MAEFRRTGKMAVSDAACHRCRTVFHGFRLDDSGTVAEIARLRQTSGYPADPHTAIGVAAASANLPGHGVPTIVMATAHPAKFPDAIERVTSLPRLADLFDRPERFTVLPNDLAAVEAQVRALARRNA
jgi:threonine synthase